MAGRKTLISSYWNTPHRGPIRLILLCLGSLLMADCDASWAWGHLPGESAPDLAAIQLPYATVADDALNLPSDLRPADPAPLSRQVPGRRVPELTLFSDLSSPMLARRVVPLPEANTLAHLNFQSRHLGRLLIAGPQPPPVSQGQRESPSIGRAIPSLPNHEGQLLLFNPEIILVKLRGQPHVGALRVQPMREWETVQALRAIPEVEFAELDVFHQRQFTPDDPQLARQWHHPLLGSFQAWSYGLGQAWVRLAIVDTPFQMDHPDLAGNTVSGWDVVANLPVTSGTGIAHSTLCAGLVAAVIDNNVGVAGAANCQVLPININGATSEMYNAIIWAADNGVRVVSISWSGADSDVLEAGAYYLKTHARGLVIMSAIDGTGHLDWTNQPDIYCISMTDDADNFTGTMDGPYIDFAAPGYQVYSTTSGSGYTTGTGTSYAAPLVGGIAAWLLGLNPALGPDEIIAILKSTARDLGPVGYDPYFGYGRIDFAGAAAATVRTLPALSGAHLQAGQFIAVSSYQPGLAYTFWRTPRLLMPSWSPVPNAIATTNGSQLLFLDLAPPPESAFYRVQAIGR